MSSDASGTGGSRFPSKVVIAAATGAVVAAGAAYYVYSKSGKPNGATPKSNQLTYDQLKKYKEDGNAHFNMKRYADAIDCFTAVIDELDRTKMFDKNVNKDKESVDNYVELLSACYQNRAAAKQASEDSPLEVIADCTHAIALKPKYAKAYIRRAQLLISMEPKQALADALAAMHIDEKHGSVMMGIMSDLMGSLEKRNLEEFERRKENTPNKRPQLITQDQMFTFLHKTLTDDYIRNLYLKKIINSSESLGEAFECIEKRNFEAALSAIDNTEEPECLLLTARLYWYQGCIEKFEESLGQFEKWIASDPAHPYLDDLKISYAVLRIETADSIANLIQLFEAAVDNLGPRADFFSCTAFRCTHLDAWEQALTILTDSRLHHSTLTQVLCYFVEINAIILRNESPMDSFKIIAKLEEFVDSLDDKDEHKNWAAFALSKVYITFNNTQNAEVLLKELMRRDPSWAIYPMALAHVYTQKSEFEEAIKFADQALELEKHNPEAQLLKQSLKLHNQGNKLDPAAYYVSLRAEAEPLLSRCLSRAEFSFVNEVLRHIAFIEAKINAANSLCL